MTYMNMFTSNHRLDITGLFSLNNLDVIVKLRLLGFQAKLDFLTVVMLEDTHINGKDSLVVLDLRGLLVGDGLQTCQCERSNSNHSDANELVWI